MARGVLAILGTLLSHFFRINENLRNPALPVLQHFSIYISQDGQTCNPNHLHDVLVYRGNTLIKRNYKETRKTYLKWKIS